MNLEELKKLAKMPAFLAEMEDVFFEAMMAGYASAKKIKKVSIAELPGSKLITPFERGPWKVADPYLVTPLSSYSGGMTVISYEGVPVWMMQYFGQYFEEAIPCLKAALRACYGKSEFQGGRGPERFMRNGYVYENPDEFFPKDFKLFRGDDLVRGGNGDILGRHVYHGGVMF